MNGFNVVGTTSMVMVRRANAEPFIKWAGGKRQLLNELIHSLPFRFENYFEPFLGGGALFFKLCQLGKIKKAYLNDCNADLITAYRTIKEAPSELIEELQSGKYANDKTTFLSVRSWAPTDPIEKTARFIYLNKTAFNGLYRVNASGKFNVPFGKYEKPKICDAKGLLAVHQALQTDELSSMDFEAAVRKARKNDFVYFDPPYHPLSKTANFTGYTAADFIEKDQERLARCFKDLDKRGCLIMLSNSSTPVVKELYAEYNTRAVKANRMINCKADRRGKIQELLVTNYPMPSLFV